MRKPVLYCSGLSEADVHVEPAVEQVPATTAVFELFLLIMLLDVTLSLGLGLISGGFNLAEVLRRNINTVVEFSNHKVKIR